MVYIFTGSRWTNGDYWFQFKMERLISIEELKMKNLTEMPGFRIKWYYQMFKDPKEIDLTNAITEPRKTEPRFLLQARTIEFRR